MHRAWINQLTWTGPFSYRPQLGPLYPSLFRGPAHVQTGPWATRTAAVAVSSITSSVFAAIAAITTTIPTTSNATAAATTTNNYNNNNYYMYYHYHSYNYVLLTIRWRFQRRPTQGWSGPCTYHWRSIQTIRSKGWRDLLRVGRKTRVTVHRSLNCSAVQHANEQPVNVLCRSIKQSVLYQVNWSIGPSVNRTVGRSISQSVRQSISRLVDRSGQEWPVHQPTDWMSDWLTEWCQLVGRSVSRSVSRSVGQ